MHRRRLLAVGGTAVVGSIAGCLDGILGDQVTESFADSYAVSSETVVAVSNVNGDVTVEPADGDDLTVEGEKRASSQSALDSITVDVVEGERFVVDVRFARDSAFESRAVDLTVGVPEGVAVGRAATTNGDVGASGVRGDLSVVTTNGDVNVEDVAGFVRAESTNGDVTLRRTTGVRGVRTTNGDVDVELAAMRGDVTCATSTGDVTVRVGEGVAAAVELRTTTGTVAVRDLPFEASADRRGYRAGRLRGADEPSLRLRSQTGDVVLRAL
jgi:DUF4097 and DUF4098 domain-containing protein YvlB